MSSSSQQLQFNWSKQLIASHYPLVAQPNMGGFFGLTELETFVETAIAPYADSPSTRFLLDFSRVKMWDISAVLWLVIGLHHYRKSGMHFLLKLPDAKPEMDDKTTREFQKSADFLRRWQFDIALQNLVTDPDTILHPEQQGYFADGPRRFYSDRKVYLGGGVLESLISQNLLRIINLVDLVSLRDRGVSTRLISKCISAFQSARVGDILHVQCGIPKRKADLFSDHLLTEGVMNIQEHPNASIGMVAISILGNSKELILALADNGDSIPTTISQVYKLKHRETAPYESYTKTEVPASERVKILDFATQPAVSRKTDNIGSDVGMGLTYIKQDTVDTFGGTVQIISDGVFVQYGKPPEKKAPYGEWSHCWKGNLLRISIPLTK